MKRPLPLLALLLLSIGAEPTTEPMPFDGRVYAMSLAGIYPHEDALLRTATDDSAGDFDRVYATQAAICNEWSGPFLLRDFALWLQKNHLNSRLRAEGTDWDNQGLIFRHLPDGIKKLSIAMPAARAHTIAVIAVDKSVSVQDVESFLENPSRDTEGAGPIIYGMRPEGFPGTIIAREKE